MRPRTRHALALIAALPLLGGSICGEVLADISQRELILEPVEQVTFDVDSGNVEIYAFDRNGTNLFYYLIGSYYDIGPVDWRLLEETLVVRSLCDSYDHCVVNWYAEVPFGVAVDVQADLGGLKVTGVDAPVTATLAGGGFEGVHFRAPTLDLDVEAADVVVDWEVVPEIARISVGEGNVQLTLPPGDYLCRLDASDGAVETTGVDCSPTGTHEIDIDVESGDIVLVPGPTP